MDRQYSELINIMRAQGGGDGCLRGVVKSVSPLKLNINGAEISKNIYASPVMLDTNPIGDYELSAFSEGFRLEMGDVCLVFREGEEFFIISKVVEA